MIWWGLECVLGCVTILQRCPHLTSGTCDYITWQKVYVFLKTYSSKDLGMENYPDFLGDSTESLRVFIGRMHGVREGVMTREAENQ